MKSVDRLRHAVAFAVSCVLVAAALPAFAQDANMMGRIAGTLLDEQGQPVANAKIRFARLDDPNGKSPETTTSKKGKFSVGFFPQGTYRPELVSDEMHIEKMEFVYRNPAGGPSGPSAEEGGDDQPGSLLESEKGRGGRGADVSSKSGQGKGDGASEKGKTFFTLKPRMQVDMTLTVAKGKAVRIDPKTGTSEINGYLKAAHDAFDANDMEGVLTATEKALALEPNNGMATFIRGLGFARLKKMDDAIPHLRRAVELIPDQKNIRGILGSALLGKAEELEAAGKAAESKPLFGEAADLLMTESKSADAPASMLQTAIYALGKAGRAEDALGATKKLVDANPGDVGMRLHYIDALRAAGKKDEALAELRNITVPADDKMNTLRVAEAFSVAGDNEAALKLLEPLAIDSREAASVLYNAAVGLINAGKPEAALPHLERAADGQPELAFIHRTLGLTYLGQNRYEDGVRELKEALRLDPNASTATADSQIIEQVEKSLKKPAPPKKK